MAEKDTDVLLVYYKKMEGNILNTAKDLGKMLNVKIEGAFDTKRNMHALETLMETEDCKNCIFFESTKRKERLWFATPNCSYKFSIGMTHSVFDMSTEQNYCVNIGFELVLQGEMDEKLKTVLKSVFNCESKKKERAIVIYRDESDTLYISHYRLNNKKEIGPRIVLKTEKVFEGCFKGKTTRIGEVREEEKEEGVEQ